MGSLLGSLLKYNAPEDFLEVLFLWSPGSLLAESSLISSGVQVCLCRGMIYNSFVSGLFCDLHVYSFSYDFCFCKFEEILIKRLVNKFIFHNIILPKLLDIIEVIDTTSIAKHNNTKNNQIYYN